MHVILGLSGRTTYGMVLAAAVLAAFGMALMIGYGRSAAVTQSSSPGLGSPAAKRPPTFKSGELIVKYKAGVRPPAAQLFQGRQPFAAYSGSARLDQLHQRYKVKAIRPLFTTPAKMGGAGQVRAEASADEWAAQVQRVRERFAVRAHRAPALARMPDLSTIYKVTVPKDTDIKQLAAQYAADPSVEYAEPNYLYAPAFIPNEPLYSSSGSWKQKYPDLWGLHNIDCEHAWDLSQGAGVTVAVIDTGLGTGPEITPNVWTNPGEIPDNGIDDDGNGYVDDVHGWDWMWTWFPDGRASMWVNDTNGHGSHVAGIIAAAGNNGDGVIGVAWQAKMMPLQIFDSLGHTGSDTIAAALHYAADNGADVVNMSIGGWGDSLLVHDAVDYAAAHGVVLVAAAGNDSVDAKTFYPAGFDPVIAVAAVDHLDQPSWFSNWGGKIELAAPGGGDVGPPRYEPYNSVLSLAPFSDCVRIPFCILNPKLEMVSPIFGQFLMRLGGTSMAAPHVSGVAALILSRHPEFTAEQVRQALRDGADDLGPPGRDARYGYGRVNAAKSVALDSVAVARLTAPQQLSRLHGELITIAGVAQNPGGGMPSWTLLFGPQGQTGSVLASGTGAVDGGQLAALDTGSLERGNYTLQLQVTGPSGESGSDSVTFTRLASRPYIRQLSDQGGWPWLTADAWTGDGSTLVWSDTPRAGSHRVMSTDLATGANRPIAEFQFGTDLYNESLSTDAVISRDGSTVAFVGPEDLSRSNTSGGGDRNFQLFAYDTATGAVQQLTHAARGTAVVSSIGDLSITPDGSRMAFVSALALDPAEDPGGVPQIFYWDRTSDAVHQITSIAPEQWSIQAPVISPRGDRVAFLSRADLDPSVGNPTGAEQAFVYDIAQGAFQQLTQYVFTPQPMGSNGTTQALGREVAFSPDGQTLAATLVTRTWVYNSGAPSSIQVTVLLLDATTGADTTLAALPAVAMPTNACLYSYEDTLRFSPDGRYLYFEAPLSVDPLLPLLAGPRCKGRRQPTSGLFRYGLQTGALQQLTGFPTGLLASTTNRLAFLSGLYEHGLDPQGTNSDTSEEIYLLDPDTAGGVLQLGRGRILQRASGTDTFSISGRLLQPTAVGLDPSTNEVSVTVLSANGELFRGTSPAGAMRRSRNRWTFSNPPAPDLTYLQLGTKDQMHYSFSAAGYAAGLFSAATPYLTVEIQVGDAVFSNAQTFRDAYKHRGLVYP